MTLAVQIDGQEKLKTYTPCSDFSVWINKFPRLVWEVCSDPCNQKDERGIYTYGTSVVKLGNCILVDRGRPPHFILVAIYQTATQARISAFYQGDGTVSRRLSSNHSMDIRLTNSRQIYRREDKLDLECRSGRFELTRRLYKLAKIFKSDDENAFNEHPFAKGLAAYVKTDEFDGTVHVRMSTTCKTDTETSLEGGDGSAGSGVTVQGYELISDVIEIGKDILEPLYKV